MWLWQRNCFVAATRADRLPGIDVDRALNESNRTVAKTDVDAAWMVTPRADVQGRGVTAIYIGLVGCLGVIVKTGESKRTPILKPRISIDSRT